MSAGKPPPAAVEGTEKNRKRMWLTRVWEEKDQELGRQQAPGTCSFCQGKVYAIDVERRWKLCCLPLCLKIKRNYLCTLCSRRLELCHW